MIFKIFDIDCWFYSFFLQILKKKKNSETKKKKKNWKWKKKKKKKKISENDQLTGHFQSFFIYFFSSPHDPKSEKKIPVNQLIKKFWP